MYQGEYIKFIRSLIVHLPEFSEQKKWMNDNSDNNSKKLGLFLADMIMNIYIKPTINGIEDVPKEYRLYYLMRLNHEKNLKCNLVY